MMLLKRVGTAAGLMAPLLALLLLAPAWGLFPVVLIAGWLALWEYLELSARALAGPPRWALYVVALGVWTTGLWFPAHLLGVTVLGAFVLVLFVAWRQPGVTEILPAGATGVFGLLVIALPLALLLDLRTQPNGEWVIFYLFLAVWAGDTAAYFAGRAFGRHKLASRLSPGKTVEGGAANLLATLVVGYWLGRTWFDLAPLHAALLPVGVNLASQLGDLAESALKRSVDVKDSSTVLPGHGGMLDRLDSLLFAAPVLWYYWRTLIQGGF